MSAACPRCGSTNPAVRNVPPMCDGSCADSWHDRPADDVLDGLSMGSVSAEQLREALDGDDEWHDRPTVAEEVERAEAELRADGLIPAGATVSDPCPKCGVPAPGHCDCDRPTGADDPCPTCDGIDHGRPVTAVNPSWFLAAVEVTVRADGHGRWDVKRPDGFVIDTVTTEALTDLWHISHDRPTGAKALPGEHLRPDGTRCSYLVAPGHPFCTKCGGSPTGAKVTGPLSVTPNSLIGGGPDVTTIDNTGADDLAARLDERARKHREFKRYRVSVDYTDADAERDAAAAARIRELEADCDTLWEALQVEGAENLKLREAGDAAVRELEGTHYPDPKLPGFCIVCSTADGSWPCTARMVADDLRKLL